MKINLTTLKDGETSFDFKQKIESFKYEGIELLGEVEVEAVLYKSINQITANVDISGEYMLTCDRCLENYETPFDTSYFIVYKLEHDEEVVGSDEDENIKFISPKTIYIDLEEDVKEYIILSLPMRHVPEEKNDICSVCGKNVNEILKKDEVKEDNPVWDKLKSLKK